MLFIRMISWEGAGMSKLASSAHDVIQEVASESISDHIFGSRFIVEPASVDALEKANFDLTALQRFIAFSYSGFDSYFANDPASGSVDCSAVKSSSLLNEDQVVALGQMGNTIKNGFECYIKLGAGEGKTFLSTTVVDYMFEEAIADRPVIHLAPFAQYNEGWTKVEDLAAQFGNGHGGGGIARHFWVKQHSLDVLLSSESEVTVPDNFKNSIFFADEYDRYPQLNDKIAHLQIGSRINLSATDNFAAVASELTDRVLEFAEQVEGLDAKVRVVPAWPLMQKPSLDGRRRLEIHARPGNERTVTEECWELAQYFNSLQSSCPTTTEESKSAVSVPDAESDPCLRGLSDRPKLLAAFESIRVLQKRCVDHRGEKLRSRNIEFVDSGGDAFGGMVQQVNVQVFESILPRSEGIHFAVVSFLNSLRKIRRSC